MNISWSIPEHKAVYILRYFLPRPPYVDRVTAQARLEELLAFCRRTHVEAVQFYVNFHENWCYMPDSPEHAEIWAAEMAKLGSVIREAGISFQLNFQVLLGHGTGRMDFRSEFPWEYLTDHRGNEVPGCACPLGRKFRERMGGQLRAWARTKPDVIWIDDDFRLHNHGQGTNGLDWYCYCPLHLGLFHKRLGREPGRKLDREQLLRSILQKGQPDDLRTQWLGFLNDTMAETAEWISGEIHSVSPETRVAQMISMPDVHAVEGRHWGDFLGGISGRTHHPLTRPHFGPYSESAPFDFLHAYTALDQTMATIRMQTEGKVDHCPEIENSRFTRWAKSAVATRFQLWLGQLLGCPGVTLSLFDLEGTALDEEPLYEELLRDEKSALDSIASLGLVDWKRRGAGLLVSPDYARNMELDVSAYESEPAAGSLGPSALLGPGRTWDAVLLRMGIPACYVSPQEAIDAEVVALDGTSVWIPDDVSMVEILAGGVLLDANAARVLIKRGFGRMIGVHLQEEHTFQTSAEMLHGGKWGMADKRMPMRLAANCWVELVPSKGAELCSTLIDPQGGLHPGLVVYENDRGGRIATYAGSVRLGAEFYNHARVAWMGQVIGWLGRNRFPLLAPVRQSMLAVRKDEDSRIMIAFSNLAADPVNTISGMFTCGKEIRMIRRLARDGEWSQADIAITRAEGSQDTCIFTATVSGLQLYEWSIFLIETEEEAK